MFANTSTADDKYSFRNMQNFLQQLQTLFLKNGRLILDFFIEILKYAWNLKDLHKKDECHSLIISEVIVSERGCYWIVSKVLLQNTIR